MTTTATPKKLLCLCGFLQNGKIFAEKSSGIRKILTKKLNFRLDYIDPPIIINCKEDLPFVLSESEEEANSKWNAIVEQDLNRCWWLHKNPNSYEGFQSSLDYVVNYIKKNGPYDGIIGFSQGAALAAVVCNSIHGLLPNHPYFDISIFISGFVFTTPVLPSDNKINLNYEITDIDEYKSKVNVVEGYEEYFTPPKSEQFKTRILNIYGSSDITVPAIRSEYLGKFYHASQVHEFKHDGGHFIPNKKQFLNPIIEMFREVFQIKSNL